MVIYCVVHSRPASFLSNGKGHKFRTARLHWPWLVWATATLAIPFGSERVSITRPIFHCNGGRLSSRTSTIVPTARFGPLELHHFSLAWKYLHCQRYQNCCNSCVTLRHLVSLFRGVVDTSHSRSLSVSDKKITGCKDREVSRPEDIGVIGPEFNIASTRTSTIYSSS